MGEVGGTEEVARAMGGVGEGVEPGERVGEDVGGSAKGGGAKKRKLSWREYERERKKSGRARAGNRKVEAAETKKAMVPTGEAPEGAMLLQKPGWGGDRWPKELNDELADIDLSQWPLTMHKTDGIR